MRCVRCGWCCINFAIPEINKMAGVRCQYLTESNLCELWDKPERPQVCNNHDMPFSVCPIGLKMRKQTEEDRVMDVLKPCPFCGGEAEVTDKDSYGFSNGDWMVCCNECHTYLGFDSQYETPEQAIEAWNRRTE